MEEYLSCVTLKQASRSLSLSYQKKLWLALKSSFGTTYRILFCCLHRLYPKVGVIATTATKIFRPVLLWHGSFCKVWNRVTVRRRGMKVMDLIFQKMTMTKSFYKILFKVFERHGHYWLQHPHVPARLAFQHSTITSDYSHHNLYYTYIPCTCFTNGNGLFCCTGRPTIV